MMEFLARKAKISWWEKAVMGMSHGEISAGHFTRDPKELKATDNALSFWGTTREPEDLEEVVLAIVSNWTELDGLTLVFVRRADLESEEIVLQKSPGVTLVKELADRHEDAIALDLSRLDKVARCLAKAALFDEAYQEFSREEVIGTLARAVVAKRLRLDNLKSKTKGAISERVTKILEETR